MQKFPNTIRKHIAIWQMDNVLTAKAIKQMWAVHQEVEKSPSTNKKIQYSDVCLKVPSLFSQSSDASASDYDFYDYATREKPAWFSSLDEDLRQKRDTLTEDVTPNSAIDYNNYEDYTYEEIASPSVETSPLIANKKTGSSINKRPTWLLQKETSSTQRPLWVREEKGSTEIRQPFWMRQKEASLLPFEEHDWLSNLKNDDENTSLFEYSSSKDRNASLQERADHCAFVEELDIICYEESLLEVWGYNDDVISNLTDEQVLIDINRFQSSRVTGFPINITSYLGGLKRDNTGKIVSAKGALYTWYTMVNMNAIRKCRKSLCKIEIDLGSGEEVDQESMEWEVHLTNIVNKFKNEGMPINLQASYLFGSVHRSALFNDIIWVCAGWGLLMMYIIITLGKPLSKDSRIIPVIIGIVCVGLSVLASYGICTAFGIPYGPLNSVLPILLIALGVDDMYVILNAWDSIKNEMDVTDIVAKTRKTLHQAGLAVTVTSLTDVIAFVIGATTEVPALRYFCVYAAVGISIVYLLQVTLFVAAVVLNQKRKPSKRGSCLPCIKLSSSKNDSANSFLSKWMGKWVKFLLCPPVTAFVLLITGIILGGAISQSLELQQRFESTWLLPKSSDIYKWFETMDKIFPKDGREGFIYFENVKLPEELPELQKLSANLRKNPYVSRVDAWFEKLLDFINNEDLFKNSPLTKELFDNALSYFLFSEEGAKYRNDIVFANISMLNCNEPAPSFTTFKFSFQYIRLNSAVKGETLKAMKSVRDLVSSANLTGYRAPWALSYGQWETEDVISYELLRNVVLVLIIVFVVTMILLASFRAALLVLFCVLATLVDVAALMNFWGLTINTVSCIALVLAIGICVDYAAHITHGFLVAQGSRKYRAEAALIHMGPAVLHGGLSTLIAFVLLAPSDTFVFLSYFKILTGVAVFGLYHAIVLLPILLALLGPPPYPVTSTSSHSSEDSQSCTTESTNYPYTPNLITPVATPQSTTPNSPSSDRNGSSLDQEESDSIQSEESTTPHLVLHPGTYLSPIFQHDQKPVLGQTGSQALRNVALVKSGHKVNMFVQGNIKDKEDLEEIRKCSLIENPAIRKENVLKLYIKNS